MKRLSFGSLVVLTLCLAVATFIEAVKDTDLAGKLIYHSWWFIALWMVLAITGLTWLIKKKMYGRPEVFCLHVSFIVILVGALLTFLTGTRGYIHLREGEMAKAFIQEDNSHHPLPFMLKLDRFEIMYYPGTQAPVNYTSHVTVIKPDKVSQETISMNNILSVNGFRLYQSSYDQDGKGTVLSINYDPFGILVTYCGYILLGLSILMMLLSPSGGFRTLLRHPLLKAGLCLLLFMLPARMSASPDTAEKAEAEKIGTLQIMYNNRGAPLQTFAKDFTRKITGKKKYLHYTPEQIVTGWIFFPEQWVEEPMIYIKSDELRSILNIEKHAPFTAFFDKDGEYRLATLYSKIHQENSNFPLLKAIWEAEEKIQIITMLKQGNILAIFPYEENGNVQWLSPVSELPEGISENDELLIRNVFLLLGENVRDGNTAAFQHMIDKLSIYQKQKAGKFALSHINMKAERLYNTLGVVSLLFKINLSLGMLLFIVFLIRLILPQSRLTSAFPTLVKISVVLLGCSFLYLSLDMGLRTYISGHLPLSNGYETMIFIAWSLMLTAILFHRKFQLIIPFGFLLSGFVLVVSDIGQMNPQITPLIPVLQSPWLSIHVSLIMMSYGLFAFTLLNGITAVASSIFRKDNVEYSERLMLVSRILLYPAVFLLGAGIFIGAVWANVSWGRYWAWDPKEVWALITFLVYGFAFHHQSLPWFRKPMFFHLYMILGFLCLLMTYFGVNHLLGGLHSYN